MSALFLTHDEADETLAFLEFEDDQALSDILAIACETSAPRRTPPAD